MGAERGSYRRERRNDAGRVAKSLKKVSSMFFGASPDERMALRKTQEKKGLKVDRDLDLNATGRGDAPEKVGENVRLIDIAMGNAPPPGPDPQRIAAPDKPALPTQKKKRRPPPRSRAGRAAASSVKMAMAVQRSLSQNLERIAWVATALGLAVAFGATPLAESLAADTAARAAEVRLAGWESARGAGSIALLAWARELGIAICALAAWSALCLRQWRAFRSPSALVEVSRTLVLASLPGAAAVALTLWVGGALTLPWVPPAFLVDPLRAAVAPLTGSLPVSPVYLAAGLLALIVLISARARRRRRPLALSS